MKLLEGKVAIVTGAARGIGKAIALKFAAEGANIAFTDLVIDENGLATQKEIEALGVKAKGYASNAANFEETHNVVAEVVKDFGRVDILVNNAGITKDGLLIRMKEEDFDRVIDVNLRGCFLCTREAAKIMLRNRTGCIVNIASVVGLMGNPGQANYCASKAGIIGLTKSSAKELAARNVRVNAVAPGFIDTEMTKSLPEEQKKLYTEVIPLKRLGRAEEVADAVAFLASPRAAYITGQVLSVNGGMYC